MRFTELEPQFIRYELFEGREGHRRVDTLAECQGVRFFCPKCFKSNGGGVGTHRIICWSSSRGTPDTASPGPGRWVLAGTGVADLSLNAEPTKSRSVALTSGCRWHGFVTDGVVTDA